MRGGNGAKFRHRYLEVAEYFEQECLKLRIGAIYFVDEQQRRNRRGNGLEQRTRQQEAIRKEYILFLSQPISGFRKASGATEQILKLVTQELRIQHLLGIFPFIQRFAFVQPYVTLQPDELTVGGFCPCLAEFRLSDSSRTFG